MWIHRKADVRGGVLEEICEDVFLVKHCDGDGTMAPYHIRELQLIEKNKSTIN